MNRWIAVAIALGLYVTLRGYHSRDGDQAHRLPLLLHLQDTAVYAADPFVRAFDQVNPHRGYLALLDFTSRVTGLSVAIFGLFAATFIITCHAVDRLARTVWPESSARVGMVAVGMVLVAKAGNLGTNHLFEAMLLDRLVAMALGWTAIASVVSDPLGGRWRSAFCVGLAGLIHPSLGVQIGLWLVVGLTCWAVLERATLSARGIAKSVSLIIIALVPTWFLYGRDGTRLMDGLSTADYLTLSASIQSPQHMMPHLWRVPQWLAGACYPVLACLALRGGGPSRERTRIVILLGVLVIGLAIATVLIELAGSVRITLFQPFRVATVARGLCLVLLADRVRRLWGRGHIVGQLRATILVAGLASDWAFVAATLIELSSTLGMRWGWRLEVVFGSLAAGATGTYLARHDTEAGYRLLAGACVGVLMMNLLRGKATVLRKVSRLAPIGPIACHPKSVVLFAGLAWLVPVAAMIVPNLGTGRLAERLATHCRFGEWPGDDVERLGAWCRIHTPADARFIGPPGPKTLRLWSRREVAFNRSASPYHAAGLADWAERFRDHVGFTGSVGEFSASYLKDRQALERGYDQMGTEELRALAERQGAGYVMASSSLAPSEAFESMRIDGRYAIYRVRRLESFRLSHAHPLGDRPERDNP